MTAPLLEVRELGFSYRGGAAALAGVNFGIEAGANLGIVGESGAGKTTLLRLLLGLVRPTAGEILREGEPLDLRDRATVGSYRRFTQAVFQDPYSSLDPRQRIGRIIAEPLRSLRIERDRPAVAARVARALVAVGLPEDAASRYPHEFSGGQRQRIAIARGIVAGPRVLLADEPVSALDMVTRVKIIELLRELGDGATEVPLTIALVSHDLGVVAALCERVVVLERGRVVEQGATAQILTDPRHPYTRRLVDSVPRLPAR